MAENHPKLSVGERKARNLGLQDRGTIELKHYANESIVLMVFLVTKNNADLIKEGLKPMTTKIIAVDKKGQAIGEIIVEGDFYPGAPDDKTAYEPLDDISNFSDVDLVFRVWKK